MSTCCGIGPRSLAGGAAMVALLTTGSLAWAVPGDAAGEPAGDAGPWWISVGLLSGSTRLDPALADYQWNVTPRLDWGAQTLVGRGRFAGGLRLWRTQATQQIDPAASMNANVRATSSELVGQARLASALGCELTGVASTGVLHLGYHPDQVTITPPGGGAPIAVDLEPVNAWIGGAGLGVRRSLLGPWAAGVTVDHRFFSLDTAHRNGSQIEYGRQAFSDWCARLELAWVSRKP
jgi:hypothetical protein